jgi:hypothetical protein
MNRGGNIVWRNIIQVTAVKSIWAINTVIQ